MRAREPAVRPWLGPAATVIALGVVVAAWSAVDRRPPEWDYANHLTRSFECHRILADPGRDRLRDILSLGAFYPPVAPCLLGLSYFAVPPTLLVARLFMLATVAVAMAAVYATGRRLLGAPAGALAAVLLASAPFAVTLLFNFQLDLPLMAAVALALWALARSDAFGSAGASVVVGAVLGAGLLTKPPFVVYAVPPLVWVVWQAARAPDRRTRFGRFAVALAVAAAIALPWYGPRLATLPQTILDRAVLAGIEEGDAPALSAAGLSTYAVHLVYVLGPVTAALFLWGLVAIRRRPAARGFLWAAALVPFAVFSLLPNKDFRYMAPLLPAAALVAAGATASAGRLGGPVVVASVAAAALQVSIAAFGVPPAPPGLGPTGQLVAWRPPDPSRWPEAEILDAIERERGRAPTAVAVIPNHPFLSRSTVAYEIARRDAPYRAARAWRSAPLGVDFVVVKSGEQGPPWTAERSLRVTRAIEGGDPYLALAYPVLAEYPLPDGTVATLRVRRIAPLGGVAPEAVAERLERLPGRLLEDPLVAGYVREPVNVRIAIEYEREAILRGEVRRVRIEADSAVVGELQRRDRAPIRVRDAAVRVDGLMFNPHRLMATGGLEVLDAAAVTLERLRVTEPDLAALLRGQPAGRGVRIELGPGEARVLLTRLGPPVSVRARLAPGADARPIALVVNELRVAGVPVPTGLVNWLVRGFDPTRALHRLPVDVSVAPVQVLPGRIVVGEERGR